MSWSFGAGDRPYTVTVYEDRSSPYIQSYCRDRGRDKIDPATGKIIPGYAYKSLGDAFKKGDPEVRDRAKQWAKDESARLQLGITQKRDQVPTLGLVQGLYLQHRTPAKVESEQDADRRRGRMWCRRLGAMKNLNELRLQEWESFIEARRSGEIDAEGKLVPFDERKPVSDGTIWADLVFLNSVMNWATKWRTEDGKYLMGENPARGFALPKEKNPRRPVATDDRLEAILAKAPEVHPFLAPLLTIVAGTGRRINAVIHLTTDDLLLDQSEHGAIRWRAENDKTGKESLVPISKDVRAAINHHLTERGITPGFVFPADISDPSAPVSRYVADRWLVAAEKLAKVTKQKGGLWHPYRRRWATVRKHLPIQDVMKAGGWSEPTTLQGVYQQPDDATLLKVVNETTQLREVVKHG
jgi:integrase-like protein